MHILFLILGVVCLAYFLVLISVGMDFAIIWAAGAVFFCGIGILLLHNRTHPQAFQLPSWVRGTIGGVLAVCLFVFLVVEGMIITHMFDKGEKGLDYVIVLGAQVRGETPSKALTLRLKTAEQYLNENPDTRAILSGGKGDGEDITEAEAMRRYLMDAGISKDRLILEDKSVSTKENLIFSASLIESKDKKAGLITNNFHVFRALQLGRKVGYTQLSGIAAPSDLKFQVHYMLREFFALAKEKLVGNI